MSFRNGLFIVLAALSLSAGATAQVTAVHFDVSDTDPVLPGHTAIDVSIDFDGQLTGVVLFSEPTAGAYFIDPFGRDTPPEDPADPGLYTYFTLGEPEPTLPPPPTPGGGSVNIGFGERTVTPDLIEVTFFPPGGVSILDRTAFLVTRLIVTDDITGTLDIQASANGVISPVHTVDLAAIVPEPAAAGVLGLSLMGLGGWRARRSACP